MHIHMCVCIYRVCPWCTCHLGTHTCHLGRNLLLTGLSDRSDNVCVCVCVCVFGCVGVSLSVCVGMGVSGCVWVCERECVLVDCVHRGSAGPHFSSDLDV
jgi:hypothetical protein